MYSTFCANLRESAMEILAMIRETFGEESMSHTHVFESKIRTRQDQKRWTSEEQIQWHAHHFLLFVSFVQF
jgi:hypothetical protein